MPPSSRDAGNPDALAAFPRAAGPTIAFVLFLAAASSVVRSFTHEFCHRAEKIKTNKLLTGVPILDEIVGGGLPTFSFNIIARAPGSGKKTQARQIVFANAFSALDFEVPSQRFEW